MGCRIAQVRLPLILLIALLRTHMLVFSIPLLLQTFIVPVLDYTRSSEIHRRMRLAFRVFVLFRTFARVYVFSFL
jgi:hypothetical protein